MLRRGIRMQLRELMADANNKALKLQRRNIVNLKVLSSSSEEANEILCILICSRRSNHCQQFNICCYLGRGQKDEIWKLFPIWWIFHYPSLGKVLISHPPVQYGQWGSWKWWWCRDLWHCLFCGPCWWVEQWQQCGFLWVKKKLSMRNLVFTLLSPSFLNFCLLLWWTTAAFVNSAVCPYE